VGETLKKRDRDRLERFKNRASKLDPKFEQPGVVCPQCGYVFKLGLTPVNDALDRQPKDKMPIEGATTVCTKCRVVLVVKSDNSVESIPREMEMLLTTEQQDVLRTLRTFLDEMYRELS
jgi:hypothetical protein